MSLFYSKVSKFQLFACIDITYLIDPCEVQSQRGVYLTMVIQQYYHDDQ